MLNQSNHQGNGLLTEEAILWQKIMELQLAISYFADILIDLHSKETTEFTSIASCMATYQKLANHFEDVNFLH